MTHFRIHRKSIRLRRLLAALAAGTSLFLAACGGDGAAGGNPPDSSAGSNPGGNDAAGSVQQREWVYVPEVIKMEDEHADYERMQLAGDTLCYVTQEGSGGNNAKAICRYSLTEREFKRIPLDWTEGGQNWDVGARGFDRDGNAYLTANVYPADYSSMTRFLCKFDSEGKCLFSRDITERLGRGYSLERLTVDRNGGIYLFTGEGEILLYTGDGEYHDSIACGSPGSPVSVQFQGACDGADGKYYVCVGKENAGIAGGNTGGADGRNISCTLMEIDFAGVRLTEVAGNLPGVRGFCAGKQEGEEPDVQGEYSEKQYDFLFFDERAVYGFDLASQKKNPGSAGEELFAWLDSDINGYRVANLYRAEDGRLYAMVADWENEDLAVVALKRTKADQAPQKEELVLATVDGADDLAAMR